MNIKPESPIVLKKNMYLFGWAVIRTVTVTALVDQWANLKIYDNDDHQTSWIYSNMYVTIMANHALTAKNASTQCTYWNTSAVQARIAPAASHNLSIEFRLCQCTQTNLTHWHAQWQAIRTRVQPIRTWAPKTKRELTYNTILGALGVCEEVATIAQLERHVI